MAQEFWVHTHSSHDLEGGIVPSSGLYSAYGKRAFDLCLAVILAPVFLPIITCLWLVAKRDGGPGFFGHSRVGQDGKSFICWKIRTMVVDAERKLDAYLAANPDAAAEWERDRKLTKDPRITKVGGFLRATSLDELPQLFNVLTGEMSFVGPRPMVQDELKRYGVFSGSYLAQKPGITGLWQVSGRNDISYDERVRLDAQYFIRRTLALDLRIILSTAGAVLKKTGR